MQDNVVEIGKDILLGLILGKVKFTEAEIGLLLKDYSVSPTWHFQNWKIWFKKMWMYSERWMSKIDNFFLLNPY